MKHISIHDIEHKVKYVPIALPKRGASAAELLSSFPNFLGAKDFKGVVDSIAKSHENDKEVIFAMGAHVVKVGCSPIICDLIERGIISAISVNGAFSIHDVELSLFGHTSEHVENGIQDGSFGMCKETVDFFREVLELEESRNITGFGDRTGQVLRSKKLVAPSVIETAHRHIVPVFIHVALGCDTIHMDPTLDFGTLGKSSMYDFQQLCESVRNLGTWLNIGSAVILPEVFLKAVTFVRSTGLKLDDIFSANFDMFPSYRAVQNVITRPVKEGHGLNINGCHEILIPLLRQAILEHPYFGPLPMPAELKE